MGRTGNSARYQPFTLAIPDVAGMGHADPVPLGNGLKWLMRLTYCLYVSIRQLADTALPHAVLRYAANMPALGYRVMQVVGCGTEEQMPDIHATRIIAAVQYVKPIRYRAVCQRPGQPVSQPVAAFMPYLTVAAGLQ